jgi:hypothetical protein
MRPPRCAATGPPAPGGWRLSGGAGDGGGDAAAGAGLPFDVWTSGRLSAYLAERTGVRLTPGWLRVLLARRRFACGRPKHTLTHLQDPDEVAACAAELAEVGEKGGRGVRAV